MDSESIQKLGILYCESILNGMKNFDMNSFRWLEHPLMSIHLNKLLYSYSIRLNVLDAQEREKKNLLPFLIFNRLMILPNGESLNSYLKIEGLERVYPLILWLYQIMTGE